ASGNMVRLSNLYSVNGQQQLETDKVMTGDIGAAVKLKHTGINDTLHTKNSDIEIDPIHFPEPIIRTAVKLRNEGDEDKLAEALHQLQREDPSLKIEHSQELKQVIIH